MIAAPFFRLNGGKRKLVPELMKHIPCNFGAYYEPFVGGGALYWGFQPSPAILSDSNPDMIAAYIAVRDNVEDLINILKRYKRDKEFYLELRARTNDDGNVIRGARFIYLLKCGYNGLWRVNKSGQYNVPFGDNNTKICDEELLRACSNRLKDTEIFCENFSRVVDRAEKDDLVYFDPPYIPISKTSDFTSYTENGFSHLDQVKLRDVAYILKCRGVHVILSNSSSPIVRMLYENHFNIHEVNCNRSINSNTTRRGPVKEVIIT